MKFIWLTLAGMCSTILRNINGTTPAEATKTTNDKLTTGTHSNAITSQPVFRRYVYNANVNSPRAEPDSEIISNFFRPNESDRLVVHKLPINCSTANAIDDTYGSMCMAPAS